MILVFVVLFFILINRLFNLQIVNGEAYQDNLANSLDKTRSVAATRGRIFDRNGVLLAYNELAYSIKISDSGTYETNAIRSKTINETINNTIEIIEENGDKITNDYPIVVDENGDFSFTIADTSLLRFLRDSYGKDTISQLSDEQKTATAKQVFEYLCSEEKYGVSEEYSVKNRLEILNLRRNMSANFYNKYMTFTVAYEASNETVAAILENSAELPGVVVEEEYIRKYVDSIYTAQILGYTGIVSSNDTEAGGYEANDIIGKIGIEQTLNSELSGVKGSKTVYVDTFGRVTEVIDETQPVTGNDVYLTIDINLQKKVYTEIEDKLVKILLTYIIPGDEPIKYKNDGTTVDKINIPIKNVYFALLDNNIVSLSKIKKGGSAVETEVNNIFVNRKSEVIAQITNELTSSPTAYSKLSEEMKVYIYYIYNDMLKTNGIINKDKIDITDPVFQNWEAESISLQEFLTYAIAQNWIDMSKLTDEKYSSLQEGYNALLAYVFDEINNDTEFDKKIYKYLVKAGAVTGRQICMMLFEQGALPMNADEYSALSSGRTSAYDFMCAKIGSKAITPAQLALEPCSGSAVITNPNNGDILALVSYPSYDNNKLSGTVDTAYYNQLNTDNSNPLINKATAELNSPGSVYKMCSAITGLEEGIITPSTTFNCSGVFDLVTPSPKCWQTWGHGNETVATAIRDSCNVFFYNVGYKLAMDSGKYNSLKGTSLLQSYAERLGLATKSGIEIYESTPEASNESSIASAIGQGTHNYSALNLARYVSTIATSGTCHNFTLVDKITDSEGNLVRDNSAAVASTMEDVSSSTWAAVHSGMRMVVENTASLNTFSIAIAGKSGTAQENTKKADHTTYVSYAPYDNPQVAVAVVIRNGYSSGNAAELTAEIYKIYYGQK